MKPKRLGRGLSGLINRTEPEAPPAGEATEARAGTPPTLPPEVGRGPIREVAVEEIRPNPYQPRTAFDEAGITELADSIRTHGILQPLVVRPLGETFELVAGERRLRAAREAGLERVPVHVRVTSDEEMQTLALVENVQRVDLNPIEKAAALRAMMRNFDWTQEEVASRVGKARATIANILRLLDLPDEVQRHVAEGTLSAAHGRTLLGLSGSEARVRLAMEAIRKKLSVRELERRIRQAHTSSKARPASGNDGGAQGDPFLADLQRRIGEALGTQVFLRRRGKKGGQIEIPWHDEEELQRLLEVFGAD